jgi:hypothetical protein
MKVIIAGSREFNDFHLMFTQLNKIFINGLPSKIVSGTAAGADKLGERYAEIMMIPVRKFPANWSKYGKSAGYKRNVEMADYADMLVAFWDGKSKGTKHMINIAENKELVVKVINYMEMKKGL